MLLTFVVCKKVEICFSVSDFVFLVQIVLEEAGRPMHIKEIKQRIIDRGLVQSKYIKPNSSSLVCSHVRSNEDTLGRQKFLKLH